MAKKDVITTVSEKLDMAKKDVTNVYNAIFDETKEELQNNQAATIPSFGTFRIKKSKATTARNPRTQEKVKVPARNRVTFKVAKSLKVEVRAMKLVK